MFVIVKKENQQKKAQLKKEQNSETIQNIF